MAGQGSGVDQVSTALQPDVVRDEAAHRQWVGDATVHREVSRPAMLSEVRIDADHHREARECTADGPADLRRSRPVLCNAARSGMDRDWVEARLPAQSLVQAVPGAGHTGAGHVAEIEAVTAPRD